MSRWVLVCVGVLGGCETPIRKCVSVSDCGAGANCEDGVCVLRSECQPACAPHLECVASTRCEPRYVGMRFLRPKHEQTVDGGLLAVSVELLVDSRRGRDDPSELTFRVHEARDGGVIYSSFLSRQDAGFYVLEPGWPPVAQGTFDLSAAWASSGLSATARVTVDSSPPLFALRYEPPRRSDGGDFGFTDPAPGYGQAYRRDELVTVRVESSHTDVDPASVTVTLSTDAGVLASFPVGPAASCPSPLQYCGEASVDFAKPELKAFRSELWLTASAADRAGNAAQRVVSEKVTRWKWAFRPPGESAVRWAPAVGSGGRVYFAETGEKTSRAVIYALKPEGSVDWSLSPGNRIDSNLALAKSDAGEDLVHAIHYASSQSHFTQYRAGGLRWVASKGPASPRGPMAIVPAPAAAEFCHAAVMIEGGVSSLWAGCAGSSTPAFTPSFTQSERGAIANGTDVFVLDDQATIRGYGLATGGWGVISGWVATVQGGSYLTMVPDRQELLAAGSGLFGIKLSSPTTFWKFPPTGAVPQLFPAAVSGDGFAFMGQNNTDLVKVPLAGAQVADTLFLGGRVVGAPALGKGGLVYAVHTNPLTQESILDVTDSALARQWTLSGILTTASSPALDCTRGTGPADSGKALTDRPGVLYVGDETGALYAFVVDSAGLDTAAQWPKLLRGPGNTNNPAVGGLDCP